MTKKATLSSKERQDRLKQRRQGKRIIWSPLPGSQTIFLKSPIFETLFEGERGPGKTDALIMDFAQHVGKGFGAEWSGILFRKTYPQLADVIKKTRKWFPMIWPGSVYNIADRCWTWPTGEKLYLRHIATADDYWNYHGHSYPWIGWEELTAWPTPDCYVLMMSCCRSTHPGMPRKYRATTNPAGVGHNWVKARFRLPQARFKAIRDSYREGKLEPPRVAIPGYLRENTILLNSDPDYLTRIIAAARSKSELKAWTAGDWNIVAGGMFDDVWHPRFHILPAFPLNIIPSGWRIDRSFDWGSSAPFSVGWWAESNGEPILIEGKWVGAVRGDIIRIAEWYGWNGKPNEGVRMLAEEIADGIVDREDDLDLKGRVRPGPADTQIFDEENGKCVANDMSKRGVRWEHADKGKGSRKQGWEQMRKLFKNALPSLTGEPREHPGLFVTERCQQFIRTIPVLPRKDDDLDEVDKNAEDHVADETRYRLRRVSNTIGRGKF